MAREVKNDRLSHDQLVEQIRRAVATELRRQQGRTPGGEEITPGVRRFCCPIDSANLATTNVDGGVQFLIMAGDRPLRIKKLTVEFVGRPNTVAASASSTAAFWALCEGRGLLSVVEAANTQVPIFPQCKTNWRDKSTALLCRHAIADMLTASALRMVVQDSRGNIGLFGENAGSANNRRNLVNMDYAPVNEADDYIVIVPPGMALVVGTKNLFNNSAGCNLNGTLEWEEDF